MEQRTLPIRIRPVEGESLVSWLDRYCLALSTTRKELYASVGLRLPSAAGQETADYSLRISDVEAALLASATGVTTQDIHRLTLAKYEGKGVIYRKSRQGVDIHFLWARGTGTRYCPACLAEDAGAWQLAWRLTWSFVCTRHDCLLLDCCDRCGRVPRVGRGISDPPLPTFCDSAFTGPYGSVWTCQRDLAHVPVLRVPSTSPLLTTQNWLNWIIESDDISPQEVARLLDDLKLLAGRALRVLTADDLRLWTASDVPDVEFEVDMSRRRTGLFPPPSGAAVAHAVTLAAIVIRTDDQSIYVPIIRRLLSAADGKAEKESPSEIIRHWGTPSPGLEQKVLKAIDEDIGPHSALRYRTAGPSPSSPPRDQTQVLARQRSVPQRFWPGWTLRLHMESAVKPKTLQTALSIGTLLPGSDRFDLKVQHEALGLPLNGHLFTYVFQSLSDPVRRAVMQALLVLASYLDKHPAPIDYLRRRQLALNQLLPLSTWQDIVMDSGVIGNPPDTARMYVAYRLTGSILERPEQRGTAYFLIQNFITATSTDILDLLDDYARDFLRDNSITEPLSWEPPLSILDGISMPAEPVCYVDSIIEDRIDRGLVEPRLIRQMQERAGGTVEALRPATDSFRTRLRQSLDRGDSVQNMASNLKKSERMIRHHLARLSGPPLPTSKLQVSLDEVHEMYVDQRLTLLEIADRIGWPRAVVRRLVLLSGAPLRSAGSSTGRRGIDPQTYAEFPPLLKNALQGHHGQERLRRFAAISNYATLRAAVRSLGLNQPTLSNQIRALEHNAGGRLLMRAERGRPMHLTRLGRDLLEVAREKGLITSGPAAEEA